MKILLASLLLFVFMTAVSAQSARQRAAIESDVRAVMNEQAAAWNRGDIEGYMRGYWNSADMVFVSGDNVTRGWQPTLDRYKKSYDSRAKMGTLTFSGLDVRVISTDAAVVLGSWALDREGDKPKGKFTLIFRKMKEGWRIVHDHTS